MPARKAAPKPRKPRQPAATPPKPAEQTEVKPKHAGGAPTLLTPERALSICDAIRSSVPLETAARMYGIHASTFHDWRKAGHLVERVARNRETKAVVRSGEIVEFSDLVDEARAQGEAQLVADIRKQSRTDQRAAAFLLERRYRENWKADPSIVAFGPPAVTFNLISSDRVLTDQEAIELGVKTAPKIVEHVAQLSVPALSIDDDDDDDDA